MNVLGMAIDIGGTKTNFAILDQQGNAVSKLKLSSRDIFGGDGDPSLALEKAVMNYLDSIDLQVRDLQGIVVGVPGKIDPATEQISSVPNLKALEGICLGVDLRSRFQTAVFVENDVNLITVGEKSVGAGKAYTDFICVFVGTGIGGGLIVNDKLYRGAFGGAGELGHMPLIRHGLECNCGSRGCLEMYCSGKAFSRQARHILRESDIQSADLNDDTKWDNAALVFKAGREGNAKAITAIEEGFKHLGHGLAIAATVTNPKLFLLGGGILNAWPEGLQIVEKTFREVSSVPFKDETDFALTQLKEDASFAGAFGLLTGLA